MFGSRCFRSLEERQETGRRAAFTCEKVLPRPRRCKVHFLCLDIMSRHGSVSVSAQVALQTVNDLRDNVQKTNAHMQAKQGDQVLTEMISFNRNVVVALDVIVTALDNGGIQNPHSRKPLSEYRCIPT